MGSLDLLLFRSQWTCAVNVKMASPSPDMRTTHNQSLIASLRFAQQAPMILNGQCRVGSSNPLHSLISKKEIFDEYGTIEQLFFSCLQSGDDKSALLCLDQLTVRFGSSNERVMGLVGLYEEAVAENQSSLEECLQKYDDLLLQNPVNVVRMDTFALDDFANVVHIAYTETPS